MPVHHIILPRLPPCGLLACESSYPTRHFVFEKKHPPVLSNYPYIKLPSLHLGAYVCTKSQEWDVVITSLAASQTPKPGNSVQPLCLAGSSWVQVDTGHGVRVFIYYNSLATPG